MNICLVGEGPVDLKPIERRMLLGGIVYHEAMKMVHGDDEDMQVYEDVVKTIESLQAELRSEQDAFEPEVIE